MSFILFLFLFFCVLIGYIHVETLVFKIIIVITILRMDEKSAIQSFALLQSRAKDVYWTLGH